VRFLGLTATGKPDAMRTVVRSGAFDTIQTPYNLLNPSAGQSIEAENAEVDYGNIIAEAAQQRMGIFAIRVFAGGALLGRPPSAHTLKTKYFPLAAYERDHRQAASLTAFPDIKRAALSFALAHPHIHAAIVGFASLAELEEAVEIAKSQLGPFRFEP
jgi:aryl-alcohol dehydrogenase-like predicted oxidoreductase